MLTPMMTGEIDPANMPEAGQAMKQAIDQNSGQLRTLLGEDGYNTYRWFELTQPEREEASQFTSAAAAGHELTPDQQSQLTDLMTAEKAAFPFQYEFGNPEALDFEHWSENFSDEKIAAYQQDMEALNGRIVERAQSVLTAEQATQLNEVLTQQLLEALVTVRSTRSMMADNAR